MPAFGQRGLTGRQDQDQDPKQQQQQQQQQQRGISQDLFS
jgi:hypothetical protein